MFSLKRYPQYFQALSHTDRAQFILSALIKLSLVFALVLALIEDEWTTAFVSVVTLAVALLPWYLARSYHFYIPVGFEFIIVLFVYATLFLGEIHGFYTRFWWWDVVLHAGSGLAFGFLGFLILYSLYRNGRFQAPPSLIAFLSSTVALAIGALWEIVEFAIDNIFGTNMQKSGLRDTMWDLIVNLAGALVIAISSYLYLWRRSRGFGVFRYYLESYFSNHRHPSGR